MGVPAGYGAPAVSQQHFPQGLIIGIVLVVVGVLLAIFAIATLIVHRCAVGHPYHDVADANV